MNQQTMEQQQAELNQKLPLSYIACMEKSQRIVVTRET